MTIGHFISVAVSIPPVRSGMTFVRDEKGVMREAVVVAYFKVRLRNLLGGVEDSPSVMHITSISISQRTSHQLRFDQKHSHASEVLHHRSWGCNESKEYVPYRKKVHMHCELTPNVCNLYT
jgi:hypothetical protein